MDFTKMRIGISGGTFDPVHRGHIEIALAAAKQLNLDKIIFVPGGEPPHKLDRRITPDVHRLAMLELAIRPYENLEISRYEIHKKGYSFSIDTVKYFKSLYGHDTELFYIVGADVAGELHHWKDYQELFTLTKFAALLRPGYTVEDFNLSVEQSRRLGADIHLVDSPMVDVSSNEIRTWVKSGDYQKLQGKIPDSVWDYIKTNNLYIKEYPFEEEFAKENMRIRLSPERYAHCERVSLEAVRIGKIVGADIEKCRLAGFLHDCGKHVSEHQLHWLDPELIEMGKEENGGSPAIIHGPAGAIIANKKYGIIDSEILEAIRCHVTGAPGMGIVAQIVFLADYTEPGREGQSFERIRQALPQKGQTSKSLAPAIVVACQESMNHVMAKGQVLSPDTIKTKEYFSKI